MNHHQPSITISNLLWPFQPCLDRHIGACPNQGDSDGSGAGEAAWGRAQQAAMSWWWPKWDSAKLQKHGLYEVILWVMLWGFRLQGFRVWRFRVLGLGLWVFRVYSMAPMAKQIEHREKLAVKGGQTHNNNQRFTIHQVIETGCM